MPEPTLSELTNIQPNPAVGTAGLTDFVPTMHEVNQQIFEAAKYKAENDWRRYTKFLDGFAQVVKDGNEIAKMDVAPQDREMLQKKMADIFSNIEKNPKSAIGGAGMFETQKQLQQLASDATQSKQDNAYDMYHRKFLEMYPDMATDSNKKIVQGYLNEAPLGARKPYMLEQPAPELDFDKQFAIALKQATAPYNETEWNVKDENGNPMEGMYRVTSGDKANPKNVISYILASYEANPNVKKAAQKRFDDLPPEIKAKYDNVPGDKAKKYYEDLANSYSGSYFAPGKFKQKGEDYWLTEKSDLKENPNYLAAQKLAQDLKKHKDEMGLNWYKATHPAGKTGDATNQETDGNIIYGINGELPGTDMSIKDGAIVDKNTGNVVPYNGELNIPADFFDNSVMTEFNKYAGAQRTKKLPDGTVVVDESISPATLYKDPLLGSRKVKFENGYPVAIKTNKGDWFTDKQAKYVTNQANIRHIKKYQPVVDISGGVNNGKGDKKSKESSLKLTTGKSGKQIYIPK